MNVLSSLQDQVIDEIKTELSDSGGTALVRVRRVENDDEVIIGEQIQANERQVAKWPHVYVYSGVLTEDETDTTNRLMYGTAQFRTFVGTRNANSDNLEAQKRLADKWCIYVASAIAGKRFGVAPYTTDESARNITIDPIANTENNALWEVSFQIPVHLSFDKVLQNVQNEA